MDRGLFIDGVIAVGVEAVHAEEPARLGVHDAQLAARRVLISRMAHGHVVRDGRDAARFAEIEVVPLPRHHVGAEQQAVIRLALEILEHFALAAAGRAFVHEDGLVFVGRLHQGGGGVAADPALVLADVQQHGVDALLGRGAGIEVVGEDLVERFAAVMDHDLPAVEVRVAEGRRDVDDGPGRIVLRDVLDSHKALHIGQGQGEEGRVRRADQQAVIALVRRAGFEGQQDHALAREPVHGLLAELGEGIAEAILEPRLVGGQVVADDHGVGVAAAHIVLHEIDGRAVLAADDLRLLDGALAHDVVDDVVAGGVRRAKDQLVKLLLGLDVGDGPAALERRAQILRQHKAAKICVNHSVFLRVQNSGPDMGPFHFIVLLSPIYYIRSLQKAI